MALILVNLSVVTNASDLVSLETQKIQYLIAVIETLDTAQFLRNGTAYDAKSAADHLRLKLRNAGSRIKTAEDFIRYCGSGSSVSGKPYEIRFSDGRVMTAEAYLRRKLAEYRVPSEKRPLTP